MPQRYPAEVKDRAAAGEKKADIAREFGVSQATVYRVLAH